MPTSPVRKQEVVGGPALTSDIFISSNGQRFGPMNLEKAKEFLRSAGINGSVVWCNGFSNWVPVSQFPELVSTSNIAEFRAGEATVPPPAPMPQVPSRKRRARSRWDLRVLWTLPILAVAIGVSLFYRPLIQRLRPFVPPPAVNVEDNQTPPTSETTPEAADTRSNMDNFGQVLNTLVEQKKAFPPSSYAKGDLPKGTYVFVSEKGGYFAEELNGQIMDNEIFASFGYVYVHGVGNVDTRGYLIKLEDFKTTGFDSPKSLYESITKQPNYDLSGYYKVGLHIPAGEYKLTSLGEGYMGIEEGPVGNSSTLQNDIFQGRKLISVRAGQFLKLERVKLERAH